ncbi:uncharacterized protein C2845_PM01G41150 [Panicum miliaceum]|uniref:Uncharacterized protein n=1 Tax=Panicum miliaceum TaxID=4540 RepID=A0A3L6TJF6_PANMI|nr:uncharacterized protein C2845_PM01G41150 [Panicum miliaceum]
MNTTGVKGAAVVWNCKKNDGGGWQRHRKVSRLVSLCDYFVQKRSYLNPELDSAGKKRRRWWRHGQEPGNPSPASKPRKKSGSDFTATEGCFYYARFGFRGKMHCRSSADDRFCACRARRGGGFHQKRRGSEEEQPKDAYSHPELQSEAES